MTKPKGCDCDKECPCGKRVAEALEEFVKRTPQVFIPYIPPPVCTRPHYEPYPWYPGTIWNGTITVATSGTSTAQLTNGR